MWWHLAHDSFEHSKRVCFSFNALLKWLCPINFNSFFKIYFYIYLYLCECVSVCRYINVEEQVPTKLEDGTDTPGLELWRVLRYPTKTIGNWPQILWKSSQCSWQLRGAVQPLVSYFLGLCSRYIYILLSLHSISNMQTQTKYMIDVVLWFLKSWQHWKSSSWYFLNKNGFLLMTLNKVILSILLNQKYNESM